MDSVPPEQEYAYVGDTSGIPHPYRWVVGWVGLLILVGIGFWYFVLFDGVPFWRGLGGREVAPAAGAGPALSEAEVAAIVRASSADPDAPPALDEEERAAILEASSAAPNDLPALSEAEKEAILRASSAGR